MAASPAPAVIQRRYRVACFLHSRGQSALETLDVPGATGWRLQAEEADEDSKHLSPLGMKGGLALPPPCASNSFPFHITKVVSTLPPEPSQPPLPRKSLPPLLSRRCSRVKGQAGKEVSRTGRNTAQQQALRGEEIIIAILDRTG